MIVRAGVVTGRPRMVVVSAGVSVMLRCSVIPARRLRPPSPGTVMWMIGLAVRRSSHAAAAV
jgi:hypothetical protein